MPKIKNYDKQVLALCSEAERRQLHERARKAGESLSRYLVKSGLGDERSLPTKEEKEAFKDAIFQVRKIGVNLNQIAQSLHAARHGSGQKPPPEQIAAAIAEVEEVIKQLKKLL